MVCSSKLDLTFSGESEMVVTLSSLRWSKGISLQTWVVGWSWPWLPCQTVECFLQKSFALVTLPALQTEITAIAFSHVNCSLENQVENDQLLVKSTSEGNLNTPNMYYKATYLNETSHFLYWDKLWQSTKQLQNCSASTTIQGPFGDWPSEIISRHLFLSLTDKR